MSDKRYGDFEMVNGATLNAANDRIKELLSRLDSALAAFRDMENAISGIGIVNAKERLITALKGIVVEIREPELPNIHHPKCGVADGLPFGEGMCICLSINNGQRNDSTCDHPVHRNPGLVVPCPQCGAGKPDGIEQPSE